MKLAAPCFTPNKLARKLISEMMVPCPAESCGTRVTMGEHQKHWETCDKREYSCTLCRAQTSQDHPGWNIAGREAFKRHLMESHEEVVLRMLDDHLEGGLIVKAMERVRRE